MPDATRVGVITVVRGRHEHLRVQRAGLAGSTRDVHLHVVVSLGDPAIAGVLTDTADALPTRVADLPSAPDALPLAAARNLGARAVLDAGAELLVFLDVDCVPSPELLERYAEAAAQRGDAVLAGPVTYLPPAPEAGWALEELPPHRRPHAARPDPEPGVLVDGDPALFWSLSFAVTAATWARIGGFDEAYTGYGAEDTDFARRAVRAGAGLVWVGGADAYHQHHPTTSPPVQHVDDVLRNGALYARRWGDWPMSGWLQAFADRGLVRRQGSGWRRNDPLRLLTVPARHQYVEAVRSSAVRLVHTDRVTGWEPDPALEPAWLARATGIDAVHLHFGYDDPDDLAPWVAEVRRQDVPLVVTVHDLRDPHRADNERHLRHLGVLLAAADEVFTLTAGAAREIAERFGRTATVVAHPTLIEELPAPAAPAADRTLLIPLKSLRTNVLDPGELVDAAVAGAELSGVAATVRVDLHPEAAHHAGLESVRALARTGRIDLRVHGRYDDTKLHDTVAGAHAVLLPYRFGTHSGWIELARDLGVRTVVPSAGYYSEQAGSEQAGAAEVFVNDEGHGLQPSTLAVAVARALRLDRPTPADRAARLAQRRTLRAEHEMTYRRLVALRCLPARTG